MPSPNDFDLTRQQRQISQLLLDIAALLMSSGAHTQRTVRNVGRIARALGYHVELFISLSGITLSLAAVKQPDHQYTVFRKVTHYGVQLSVVSAVSRLSWRVHEENLALEEIRTEVERIANLSHYSKTWLVIMISLAGMAFCRIAGGEILPALLTGLATASGFLVRNTLLSKNYNLSLSVFTAAFVASGLSGLGLVWNIGTSPEIAVATSVLFLIPGVPMINSIIDLMHGHILTGQGRAMQGMVISFAIALGIFLSSTALKGVMA